MQRRTKGHKAKKAAANVSQPPPAPSEQDCARLLDAIEAGNLARVQKCLARGFSPSWSKKALHAALRYRFVEIYAALIKAGANAEVVADIAFREARSSSMAHMIDTIVGHLTPETATPILLYRSFGNVAAMKALLRAGISPNCILTKEDIWQNYAPCPPLVHALLQGYPQEAMALIEAGADVSLRKPLRADWHYWLPTGTRALPQETFLHFAASHFSLRGTAVAQLLIDKGVDPAVGGEFGALRVAILFGRMELLELFLRYGAPADKLLEVAFHEAQFKAIYPLLFYGGLPPASNMTCRFTALVPSIADLGTLLYFGGKFEGSDVARWVRWAGVTDQDARSAALARRLRPSKLM